MSKIIAIDYGLKRCGIAITDDAKIVASPLTVVDEKELMVFLQQQVLKNKVDEIVLGMPVNLMGEDTHITQAVRLFYAKIKVELPGIAVHLLDERFTSSLAQTAIHQMQLPKHKREQKGLVDKVSAAILLQSFMAQKKPDIK